MNKVPFLMKSFISLLLIGGILSLFWMILFKVEYFKVKQIIVNNNFLKEREKKALMGEYYNKKLYEIELSDITIKAQNHFSTQSLNIIKKYPDTLIINIIDKSLVAYITNNNKTYFGVDQKGEIITILLEDHVEKVSNFPLIQTYIPLNKLSIGSKVLDKSLVNGLKSLYIMKKIDFLFYKKINKIHNTTSPNKNYLMLKGLKTKFYFGNELSLSELMKVDTLEEDLSTRMMFHKIDLRFDDIIGRN